MSFASSRTSTSSMLVSRVTVAASTLTRASRSRSNIAEVNNAAGAVDVFDDDEDDNASGSKNGKDGAGGKDGQESKNADATSQAKEEASKPEVPLPPDEAVPHLSYVLDVRFRRAIYGVLCSGTEETPPSDYRRVCRLSSVPTNGSLPAIMAPTHVTSCAMYVGAWVRWL